MGFSETQVKPHNEEDDYTFAMQLAVSSVLPMTLQAVIELNVFEIISSAGENAQLSAVKIASHLETKIPKAAVMLDRMLRLLANHSVLTCSTTTHENGNIERIYGLAPVCKYFIDSEDGVSLTPYMFLCQDSVDMQAWYRTKDAVLEGGCPFDKVYGMNLYEYNEKDGRHNKLFNKAMVAHTVNNLKRIVEVYNGFENVKVILDVGGGIGTLSNLICSKYPATRCINFELPHVIENSPSYPGVEHVVGDMFESIPRAETLIMKSVLHNWDDENCLKILKNCYEALPGEGMLIVVDIIFSVGDDADGKQKRKAEEDVLMMVMLPGGKERNLTEFEALAKDAGFDSIKLVCSIDNYSVMEFNKVKAN